MPADQSQTYQNPVYPRSFADPFVLKCRGVYYAYCTGFADSEDEVFRVLSSSDLVNWTEAGFAMRPLASLPPFYWAPEVTYWNGLFYLYYSAGNEALMEIRVAVSDRPDRGFEDAGQRLTHQDFAIDAHVFTDDDGQRYMFYATDFLDHSHIGTGTVVDRMVDPFTLAGNPRPVTRARYDWQVYDTNRKEKGGVRWHTVEGPSVFKRKGTYFEMFSGGNWQNTSYGVSFATTDSIERAAEWDQYSDGDKILPLLRTVPGEVIGPGHNSIVLGPNNRELYCVYHRWTDDGRVMAIDRMDVVGDRLFVRGPTNRPQPAPFKPQRPGVTSLEHTIVTPPSFLLDLSVRCTVAGGDFGLILNDGELNMSLIDELPNGLDPSVFHDFRIEVDSRRVAVSIDGWFRSAEELLDREAASFRFYENGADVELGHVSLTGGFEDLFDGDAGSEEQRGWSFNGRGDASIADGMIGLNSPAGETVMSREMRFGAIDLAANLKRTACGAFGVRLLADDGVAAELSISDVVQLSVGPLDQTFPLPTGWTPDELHQYELMSVDGRLTVYLEDLELASLPFDGRTVRPAIFCREGSITVEMVRATAI